MEQVFVAKFEEWMRRRQNSPYDATGSSGCPTTTAIAFDEQDSVVTIEDEKPFLSINGHAGRITKVHCIHGFPNDFVTTSYDGTWKRWRIDAELKSLSKLVEGSMSKADERSNERICSSIIISENDGQNNEIIYFGTSSGCLYRSWLSQGGESEKIYQANERDRCVHNSIDVMATYRSIC